MGKWPDGLPDDPTLAGMDAALGYGGDNEVGHVASEERFDRFKFLLLRHLRALKKEGQPAIPREVKNDMAALCGMSVATSARYLERACSRYGWFVVDWDATARKSVVRERTAAERRMWDKE